MRPAPRRRGTIIPMLAISIVALLAFCALAIDLGVLMVARTECQNAADASALSGCRTLDNKVPSGMTSDSYDNQKANAEINARDAIKANYLMTNNFTDARVTAITVGIYEYDTTTNTFQPNFTYGSKPAGKAWTAVRTTVTGDQPTFFAKIFGLTTMPTSAYAVAIHRPRDVAMVLDYTGSMGYGTFHNYSNNSLNSSDTVYPRFSHYERYGAYSATSPTGDPNNGTPGNRPHPLYTTATIISGPYVYSPANLTVETSNGPPIVRDFYYDPGNVNDPATPDLSVNPSALRNAFHSGTISMAANARTLGDYGPTPAPANWGEQTDTPSPFVGDKFPRKGGYEAPAAGAPWSPTNTNGAAVTLAEYLGWSNMYTGGSTLPALRVFAANSAGRGTAASTNDNFRDATWERYGYDLDVAHYIANRDNGTTWDPRYDGGLSGSRDTNANTPNPPTASRYVPVVNAGSFVGYTMGPAYYGKTFFMWPPDPRPALDWRKRFFLEGDGTPFEDADNIDALMFTDPAVTGGNGRVLRGNRTPTTFAINYGAVLAWLKSGPQVLPPNLRSGRVLYYSSIPNDVNTAVGTADERADKAFWREYIKTVLLTDNTGELAGNEPRGWPEGVTPDILYGSNSTATSPVPIPQSLSQYVANKTGTTAVTDPYPYSAAVNNPVRPRLHFWFGPMTMMAFINERTALSGSTHQAQSWQLKAGVNSALDDIKANHPNDNVGMAFFTANRYSTIMVPMAQEWATLKNSLFFPRSLLPTIPTNPAAEVRPFSYDGDSVDYTGKGNVPNAQDSTDWVSGMTMGFNLLANSSYVNSNPTRRGRRGANKIVIFETDGVPNNIPRWNLNRFGYETYYSYVGTQSTNYTEAQSAAASYTIVDQIVKPTATVNSSSTDSGHSSASSPARVYAIGFGDIFSTSVAANANNYLVNVQKRGNTSKASDTTIPSYQIITGTYETRIENLRTALERIMQSGVQVTLIE